MSRALIELLIKDRVLSPQHAQEAMDAAAGSREPLAVVKALVEKQRISDTKLLQYLAQKFSLPSINLSKYEISPEVVRVLPADAAKRAACMPIQNQKGTLVVAIVDPTQISLLEDVKFRTKLNVEAVLTSYSSLEQALQRHFSGLAGASAIVDKFQKEQAQSSAPAADGGIELVTVHDIDGGGNENDAPIIQFVNTILTEGIRKGASDIHIEPYEKRFRVRLRVDGVLQEVAQIPTEMKRGVIARFKIMSRMDIAESRIPQDGRIKLKLGGQEVDFRVNSMPTLFGEKVVLRMLSKGNLQLDLQKLGFEPRQLEVFKKGIYAPNGMVLVTGPTGSGKTTTLYSALSELNKVTDNISTAEDPVEYNLEGINQVQVQKEIGLSFASVLRALLRQDPDTVLVGEIRDYETAEVAIQAALTGHLVLSTLHTNDAPSTITRLTNMGVEPFLVVASLNTIVAQRLVRKLCPKCRVEQPVPAERLAAIGFAPEQASGLKVFTGKGCSACGNTGYKGRLAVYEVLDFSPTLKELVLRGESVLELRRQAVREGMKTLRASALSKVAEGITSLEEALTLTMEN